VVDLLEKGDRPVGGSDIAEERVKVVFGFWGEDHAVGHVDEARFAGRRRISSADTPRMGSAVRGS